jgi:uncharacterized membrane protein YkvI
MTQFHVGMIALAAAGMALVAARDLPAKVAGLFLIVAAGLLSGVAWETLAAVGGVALLLLVAAAVVAGFSGMSRRDQ